MITSDDKGTRGIRKRGIIADCSLPVGNRMCGCTRVIFSLSLCVRPSVRLYVHAGSKFKAVCLSCIESCNYRGNFSVEKSLLLGNFSRGTRGTYPMCFFCCWLLVEADSGSLEVTGIWGSFERFRSL